MPNILNVSPKLHPLKAEFHVPSVWHVTENDDPLYPFPVEHDTVGVEPASVDPVTSYPVGGGFSIKQSAELRIKEKKNQLFAISDTKVNAAKML